MLLGCSHILFSMAFSIYIHVVCVYIYAKIIFKLICSQDFEGNRWNKHTRDNPGCKCQKELLNLPTCHIQLCEVKSPERGKSMPLAMRALERRFVGLSQFPVNLSVPSVTLPFLFELVWSFNLVIVLTWGFWL